MARKPLDLALALVGSAIACLPIHAQSPTPSPVAHPTLWPAAASPSSITDRATEARIAKLLAGMTLEQKVGQTIQADISSIKPEDLDKYPIGSILAGGNSGPFGDERGFVLQVGRARPRIPQPQQGFAAASPIIFGVDAVHGHSNVPGATIFPHNIALGATHDPALIRQIGAATARRGLGKRHRMDLCADSRRPAGPALGSKLRRLFVRSKAGRLLRAGDDAGPPGHPRPVEA